MHTLKNDGGVSNEDYVENCILFWGIALINVIKSILTFPFLSASYIIFILSLDWKKQNPPFNYEPTTTNCDKGAILLQKVR